MGEPSRSFHGEGHVRQVQIGTLGCRVPPGYGDRYVLRVRSGTGETRLRSLVSKDRSYKPMVKSDGAQRESDGVKVPVASASGRHLRRGPDVGHAVSGGKREGMTGTARSNYLHRRPPVNKVRQLQRQLYVAAKRSPERRFHALYDRVCRSDVLAEGWRRVRSNRGAAEVDRETLAMVEEYGEERMLRDLQDALEAGTWCVLLTMLWSCVEAGRRPRRPWS